MRFAPLFVLVSALTGCGDSAPSSDDSAFLPDDQAGPPPFVIDSNNNANNTNEYYIEVSGNWTSSTNVAGYWNTGYWVAPAVAAYDPANFYFNLNADSCLIVESWWTAAGDRAPNTPFQSYNASGTNLAVRYVDQRANGGRWNEIGRYIFTAGWNRVLISRWANSGTYVVADAVRLTPATNCPGWCGGDADGDGVAACNDTCDNDPRKTSPGQCGCGVADTNTDGDAQADCVETCDTDPAKLAPGVCGCGVSDANTDGDALVDCQETCDNDPGKTAPGVCGCGVSDANTDGDAFLDCQESCDNDPLKTTAGVCGCGVSDANTDGDALIDCQETCPTDPLKTAPGVCGCGVSDANTDGDAALDCQETCDANPAKTEPGQCGCGTPDTDTDGDLVADCVETCDVDPLKTAPGVCGCGIPDEDLTGDGTPDCTICGNGIINAPETCDDNNRAPGDGCDESCQWEDLLFSITPGVAGVQNTLLGSQAQPGRNVTFLASYRLGSTPVPGCPGVRVPLDNPMVVGQRQAGPNGEATMTPTVPANLAGRTYALVSVEVSSCRVSEVWFETF